MEQISAPDTLLQTIVRLGLAVLFGAAIGINRELLRKPAGLQTHSLVSLGSALVAIFSLQIAESLQDSAAVSRIMQGLVAGIGFIGGGVILHRHDRGEIYGITTAASIWVVAGAGSAVGLGLWRLSGAVVAMSLGILIVFGAIDNWLQRNQISQKVDPPPEPKSKSNDDDKNSS